MRAMSENADSARLSGVWIRRTSTLTWTVAGALSAFTAILNAPSQTSALTQALSPDLLLYALTAALVGAMVNLTVAFVAGVGMGVFLEVLAWNVPSPAKQQLVVFIVVMVVLLVRVGALRKGARTGERSTWQHGAVTTLRERVGPRCAAGSSTGGVWATVVVAVLLPFVLSVGNDVLMSTHLHLRGRRPVAHHAHRVGGAGVAGPVRPGRRRSAGGGAPRAPRVPLLARDALRRRRDGRWWPIVVGLPALRMPGLFLAVTTLAFAIFMQNAVLATPCFTRARASTRPCAPGCPTRPTPWWPAPRSSGSAWPRSAPSPGSRSAVLLVSIFMVRVWRDRGVARRLVAVRDNEIGAAAMGIPVLRTKLLAFGLSGFMAGYAGVCFAFAAQQLNNTDITFDPTTSFVIISMVVIGGLGSIPGAILGALYLEGLPAIFDSNQTIQFITSGLGLIALHPVPARWVWPSCSSGPATWLPMRIRAAQERMASGRTGPPGGARHGVGRRRGRAVSDRRPRPASRRRPGGARPASRSTGSRVRFGGVHALDGVSFDGRAGSDRRAHRGQRVGEDDHARRHLGPGGAAGGHGPRRRHRPGRVPARGAAEPSGWSGRSRTAVSSRS